MLDVIVGLLVGLASTAAFELLNVQVKLLQGSWQWEILAAVFVISTVLAFAASKYKRRKSGSLSVGSRNKAGKDMKVDVAGIGSMPGGSASIASENEAGGGMSVKVK